MQNIQFHLAYLLTKHECVIIPDFGALVVSPLASERSQMPGMFTPPRFFLGFNPDIRHNDGLLANLVAKDKQISYKEACKLMREWVDRIKNQLKEHKTIEFRWIGSFSLSEEQKVIFKPAGQLSCNADNLYLPKFHASYLEDFIELHEIENAVSTQNGDGDHLSTPMRRRFFSYTAGISAAVLALFLVATPLNDRFDSSLQNASLFCHTNNPILSDTQSDIKINTEEEAAVTESTLAIEVISEPATTEVTPPVEIKATPSKYYYIVISSLPTLTSAESTLKRFQANGFENADIISSEERHRIYVQKFVDKTEAEAYLKEFRINNPKHAKAWLLSQQG